MNEINCYSPYVLIILPKLLFDEEGNISEFSYIGMAIEPMLKVNAKESSDLKTNIKNDDIITVLNSIKNYFGLSNIEINVFNDFNLNSINYLSTITLACSFIYLWISNQRNLYENLDLIDSLIYKNKVGLQISHIVLNGGFGFYSKSNNQTIYYRLPYNKANYELLILEKGSYNFFDIIKDKNYRNVLAHHTKLSYDAIQNDMSLKRIYEENKRIAFDTGLIDSDLYEIIKLLSNEGFISGYNFFTNGMHVIAKSSDKERILKILEGITDRSSIKSFRVNYTGLFIENNSNSQI